MSNPDTDEYWRDGALVGKMVETCVYVCGERKPTGNGLVISDRGNVCEVDICYPHAKPWIVYENKAHLRVIERATPTEEAST